MAKTTAATLITDLCNRVGWKNNGTTERVDALRALNVAERFISLRHSMKYLEVKKVDLSLANTNDEILLSTFAAGWEMDYGKAFTIQRPAAYGDGRLTYFPVDRFVEANLDTYGLSPITVPSYVTVVIDAGGNGPKLWFKPSNTTGSALTFIMVYQRVVPALTDSGAFSVLPEGYEDTILIDRAEAYLKRLQGAADAQILWDGNLRDIDLFYEGYRTTKEQAMTDREQIARKQSQQLDEGV